MNQILEGSSNAFDDEGVSKRAKGFALVLSHAFSALQRFLCALSDETKVAIVEAALVDVTQNHCEV